MTGHFITADGCEKWEKIYFELHTNFYKQPTRFRRSANSTSSLMLPKTTYGYRMYELESIEYGRGIAHFVEVEG
jgi:hypothetical protein